MITRTVRNGYTLHLPKGVIVQGGETVKATRAELAGQEHKLEPVQAPPKQIERPVGQPTTANIDQAENRLSGPMTPAPKKARKKTAKKAAKKKRGQRGRSRIRKD